MVKPKNRAPEMVVLVVDSGSGSIKFGEARINSKTGEISSIDYYDSSMSLAADLENHGLVREIETKGIIPVHYDEEGKPLNFSAILEDLPYSADARKRNVSYKDIYDLYGNKFSEEIKEQYIDTMVSAIRRIKEDNPTKKIGFRLVGTAALRKAEDAPYLLARLSEKLDELGVDDIDLKIISQRDEGMYAFKSAQEFMGGRDNVIVADAGGGSRQFTKKGVEGEIDVAGDAFASAASRKAIANFMEVKEGQSIYPFAGDVKQAIHLLKGNIDLKDNWVSQDIEAGVKVVGAGNIYSSILSTMQTNGIKSSGDKSYNKEDVMQLVDLLSNKPLEEVKLIVPEESHAFIENILTNALLIAATMEVHNIPEIEVVKVSNAQALVKEAANRYAEDRNTREDLKRQHREKVFAARGAPEDMPQEVINTSALPIGAGRESLLTGSAAPALGEMRTPIQDPSYSVGNSLIPLVNIINRATGNWIGKIAGFIGFERDKVAPIVKNIPNESSISWENLGKENSSDIWKSSKIEADEVMSRIKSAAVKTNPVVAAKVVSEKKDMRGR